MRKFSQMILTLLFAIPMLFGGLSTLGVFSDASNSALNGPNTLLATSNGGGGADSLKGDDNGDLPHPDAQETITYTFKTYEDYFIDYFNIPAELYTRDEATGAVTIDYSNIKRTTANGETQLSYNGNVFYTVTSQDLTGSGSEVDPFVVHSTNGFLYLTNSLLVGRLNSKYIELNCNIILNDEVFDEEGTPKGGDGIVYVWEKITSWSLSSINGYNFNIDGVYLNKESEEIVNFCNSTIQRLKNLNFKNVFIKGKTLVSCFCKVYEAMNVKLLSGNIVITANNGYGAGLFDSVLTQAVSCYNYANVGNFIAYQTGGVARRTSTNALIKNCNNYGTIKSHTLNGGIIATLEYGIIEGCNNYGKVLTDYYHSGGLVGSAYSGVIKDSNNYGEIISGCTKSGIVGAFVAVFQYGYLSIMNCSNYGKLCVQDDMNKQPGLIGYLFGSTNLTKNNVINMYNCFANSGSGEQFFQSQHSRADACVELNISNCTLLHDSYNRKNIGLFAASIVCKVNINIENLKIRIISDNLKVGYFRELYGIGELKLNAKNLYVEFFGENITFNDAFYYYPPNIEKYQINCDSLIFNYNNLFGDYYGTDFSAFYFSWRTGKIGLIALDGRGSFQGKIDEDWLLNKGYQKGNL